MRKTGQKILTEAEEALIKNAPHVSVTTAKVPAAKEESSNKPPAGNASTTSTTKVSSAEGTSTSTTLGNSSGSQTNTTAHGHGDTSYKPLRPGSPEKVVSVLDSKVPGFQATPPQPPSQPRPSEVSHNPVQAILDKWAPKETHVPGECVRKLIESENPFATKPSSASNTYESPAPTSQSSSSNKNKEPLRVSSSATSTSTSVTLASNTDSVPHQSEATTGPTSSVNNVPTPLAQGRFQTYSSTETSATTHVDSPAVDSSTTTSDLVLGSTEISFPLPHIPVPPPLPTSPHVVTPGEWKEGPSGTWVNTPFSSDTPPPNTPKLKTSTTTTSHTPSLTFAQQIELGAADFRKRQDNQNAAIQSLRDKELCIPYEPKVKETGEKLSSDFYPYLKKDSKVTEQINFPENTNVQFHVGLLNITNEKDTEYLPGVNMHMVLYITHDNQTILWGFLTSQNDNKTIKLSDTQPFSNSESESPIVEPSKTIPRVQYLRVLDTPLLVSSGVIESLPDHVEGTEPHDVNRTNQQIAIDYIKREDINHCLTQAFQSKVIPKFNTPVEVYDGVGVTMENIDQVLEAHNKEMEKQANEQFQKYKQSLSKSKTKIQEWITKREEKLDKEVYTRLIKKIDDYNVKK